MPSKIYSIDSASFLEIVKTSVTFTEMLRKCGLENKGCNINTVKRRIKKERIDCSHIRTGLGHNKGKCYFDQRISKEDALKNVFVENSKTKRSTVKTLLIRYELKKYECGVCQNNGQWNDNLLSLQLDHINGKNNDNRLENLRFLCPNCHSQTETYCGKSTRKKIKPSNINPNWRNEPKYKTRKVNRPSKEILEKEVKENTMVSLGKKYGVSDNAVRKWCKSYGMTI